jgi:hypothetical protein
MQTKILTGDGKWALKIIPETTEEEILFEDINSGTDLMVYRSLNECALIVVEKP